MGADPILLRMSEANTDLRSEISELLTTANTVVLKEKLSRWLPADIAPILADLPVEKLAVMFRLISREVVVRTFPYLATEDQQHLLALLSPKESAALLNRMSDDDRTSFLNELEPEETEELLATMAPAERQLAEDLLAYPDHSVGQMMTLDFVTVRPEWTVGMALDHIRRNGHDRETLNVVYVVDEKGRLADDVRVRRFLLAPLDRPVRELMDGNYAALSPMDDRERALEIFRKYDRVALPVIGDLSRLIGIVTVDDMLDVADEEATEDIQKLGGSEAFDEPYTSIPLSRMIKKRAGWLVILFFGEMLTASAMAFYEAEIAKAVVLALFIPLVISSGGNAGSQAATLVIRSLALGEFKLRQWWLVMRRELAAGLSLGLILGAFGFVRIAVWQGIFHVYGEHWVKIAGTLGISLVGIVLWGSLVGSMFPLILKRLGMDPATSSAPFVATLVDVTGLVIYFSVAFMLLRGTLL